MSNGCGCESGVLKYIKPPLSKMFYAACCIHDDAYDRGGTRSDRKEADRELYRNMCRIIDRQRCSVSRSFLYTLVALLYYVSVRLAGRFYFNYSNSKTI